MVKIPLNGFGRLGRLAFMSSIGADSFSYAELKETAEKLMQPTLPTVFIPRGIFELIPPKIISEQERVHHCIIKPAERIDMPFPIDERLFIVENFKEFISRTPLKVEKVEVDTEDLPKERYHDRTFPKDYWKKKKAKRRIQKKSRRQKFL